MRQQYNKAKAESFKTFNVAMEQLETLMREHIAGEGGLANSSNESHSEGQE
jgi:hypothetical protein